MPVTVNWPTKVIDVPISYMNQIQVTPVPIYELDLNAFRLDLKALEWGFPGMGFVKTHNHNPPFNLGGVELARTVDIVNNYTVTFEDGQYAVNLIGANSNVGDRVNVNQVSVRSANSAGLVTSTAIEFGEYGDKVTVDVANLTGSAVPGTIYPTGTLRQPSDNLVDARLIATSRGFTTIAIVGDITITTGDDVSHFIVLGTSHVNTLVTIEDPAVCDGTQFNNCNVTGILDGDTHIEGCMVGNLNYVNGHIHSSGLYGTIVLGGSEDAAIVNCYVVDNQNLPTVDMGGSGQNLVMIDYAGSVTLKNLSDSGVTATINLDGGSVILDSTISAGTIKVTGIGMVIDNSTGSASLTTINLVSTASTATAVWGFDPDDVEAGTMGTVKEDTANILLGQADMLSDLAFIKEIEAGEWKIESNQMIFYAPGGAELIRFNLFNKTGGATDEDVYRRVPV